MANNWKNEDSRILFQAILSLKTIQECEDFFRDLMTLDEIKEMGNRFKIARMLYSTNKTYLDIAKEAKTTTTTITRVAFWLKQGTGGYRKILQRLFGKPAKQNHYANLSRFGVVG